MTVSRLRERLKAQRVGERIGSSTWERTWEPYLKRLELVAAGESWQDDGELLTVAAQQMIPDSCGRA